MEKYVSGIRPSGKLHLGNYLGVLKYWKNLQDNGKKTYFFVANMHGKYTQDESYKTQDDLYKIGISAYWQSEYKTELLALQHELSFYTNTSRLDNMTQYKEKGGTLALYSYPVLMAADIIFHEATHVPIGDDQKQHLELVRELARKINKLEPKALINPVGSRIMSLKDPTKKMSKSNTDENECIYISDSPDLIAKKIKSATTSTNFSDDVPAANNLKEIYKALGGINIHNKWGPFKDDLIGLLIHTLCKN